MGRIADLASGWTVEGDAAPAADSGPVRSPRRATVTQPPPPPGSAERQALEDRIAALTAGPDLADVADDIDDDDDDSFDSLREPRPLGSAPRIEPAASLGRAGAPRASGSTPPAPRLQQRTPLPLPRSRQVTGDPPDAPTASGDDRVRAKRPAREDGAPIDLSMAPEADRTTENRGAVGIKNDSSGSHTANAASGTIGGDTPVPVFGRPAVGSIRAAGSYSTGRAPAATADSARFAVPLGEFDHGELIEQDKLRAAYSHAHAPARRRAGRAGAGRGPSGPGRPRRSRLRRPRPSPCRLRRSRLRRPRPSPCRLRRSRLRRSRQLGRPRQSARPAPAGPALRGDPRFNDASGSSTARFERADSHDGADPGSAVGRRGR